MRQRETAMGRIRKAEKTSLILAVSFLALAPIAGAQRAGMSGMMAARVQPTAAFRAPAGTVMVRASGVRAATSTSRARGAASPRSASTGDFLLNGPLDPYLSSGGAPFYINGVLNAGPGSAYYGTNSLLGVKAFIDPATQMELATYERLQRDLGSSGIYIPLLPMYAAIPTGDDQGPDANAPPDQGQAGEQQQQQPQVIIVQEAPQPGAENSEAQQNSPAEEQAPLPDEGEFVLIFRDGRSDQAAAFTKSGDQVVYITPDGTRHAVALSEIDIEETQRVNQERGTPLQLSAE